MRWLSLPNFIMKIVSLICFVMCSILQIVDYIVLYKEKGSHCIAGYELGEELGVHIIGTFGILVCDIVYSILIAAAIPFPNCNFGADLLTIGHNFVAGFLGYATLQGIAAAVSCGNESFAAIQNAAVACTTLSCALHWINGIVSLMFVAQIEQQKRRRVQPE